MHEEQIKLLRKYATRYQLPYKTRMETMLGAAVAIESLLNEIEKYRHAAFVIGETCVDASKCHISPEAALEKIRKNIYYTRHE